MKSMYLYNASRLLGDHTCDKMAHIRDLNRIHTDTKSKRSERVPLHPFAVFYALQANVLP